MKGTHTTGKRLVGLLALTAVLVVAGLTAAPGFAAGPSPEQLQSAGWTCFAPPPGGFACFNPAQGRPPLVTSGVVGGESYLAMRWTSRTGEFVGTVHLIRADLYNGQPCPQAGGPYTYLALIGYYECAH